MRNRVAGGLVVLAVMVLSSLPPGVAAGAPDSTLTPVLPLRPQVSRVSLATPRSSVQGYLVAARATRYSDAARYLDLSQVPESERAKRGPLLAREMKVVLDQYLWIDLESLSEQPEGDREDGLAPNRDRIGVIQTSRGAFEINLIRTPVPDGESEWRFTPGTLDRVELLYSETGYGALLSWIPNWATAMRIGNVEGWQWLALILLAVLATLASNLLTGVAYAGVGRLARKTEPEFRNRLLESIRPPVRLTSALAVVTIGASWLRLSLPARHTLTRVGICLLVALVAWTLTRLVDLAVSRTLAKLQAQGRRSGVSTLVLIRRVLKGVIVVVAGLALLQNFGFNVSGLLAGFGIAGAAVALAAQKTIESLFAGLVLSADEPVRIGDFCKFGNQQGTVEDIGLRSTRIRTLDRTVLSVPNAEMAAIQIENFAARDRIRLLAVLSLRYETTRSQLTSVLERIRDLLGKHPRVSPQDIRVRFVAFGPYSLNVELVAYVLTSDFPTFLEVQEELFLRIMAIVSECGTGFAFPSQTLYMARDTASEAGAPERKTTS